MLDMKKSRHAGDAPVVSPSKRKHVYAVTTGESEGEAYGIRNIGGGPLYGVEAWDLRAIVSEVDTRDGSQRAHGRIHRHVWNELGRNHPLLPMGEKCIVDDLESLRRTLEARRSSLLDELDRVGERIEVQFKIRWDVSDLFERLSSRHDELKQARRQCRNERPSDGTRRLGEVYESVLAEQRRTYREQVDDALGGHADDVRWLDPHRETTMVHAALLIDRDDYDALEIEIFNLADAFDPEMCFDYTEPNPPSRFVDVELAST